MHYKIQFHNTLLNFNTLYNFLVTVSKFFIIIKCNNIFIIYIKINDIKSYANIKQFNNNLISCQSYDANTVIKILQSYLVNYDNSKYITIDSNIYSIKHITIINLMPTEIYINLFDLDVLLKNRFINYFNKSKYSTIQFLYLQDIKKISYFYNLLYFSNKKVFKMSKYINTPYESSMIKKCINQLKYFSSINQFCFLIIKLYQIDNIDLLIHKLDKYKLQFNLFIFTNIQLDSFLHLNKYNNFKIEF